MSRRDDVRHTCIPVGKSARKTVSAAVPGGAGQRLVGLLGPVGLVAVLTLRQLLGCFAVGRNGFGDGLFRRLDFRFPGSVTR
ncbi:MAG: hypothetical protein ACRDU4_11950, partial [Mycobacterium sp.]